VSEAVVYYGALAGEGERDGRGCRVITSGLNFHEGCDNCRCAPSHKRNQNIKMYLWLHAALLVSSERWPCDKRDAFTRTGSEQNPGRSADSRQIERNAYPVMGDNCERGLGAQYRAIGGIKMLGPAGGDAEVSEVSMEVGVDV